MGDRPCVASEIDPATERIIRYLAGMDVPINVVFFRYYTDDGQAYLARTSLLQEGRMAAKPAAARRQQGAAGS